MTEPNAITQLAHFISNQGRELEKSANRLRAARARAQTQAAEAKQIATLYHAALDAGTALRQRAPEQPRAWTNEQAHRIATVYEAHLNGSPKQNKAMVMLFALRSVAPVAPPEQATAAVAPGVPCGLNPYQDDVRIKCTLPKGHSGWCSDLTAEGTAVTPTAAATDAEKALSELRTVEPAVIAGLQAEVESLRTSLAMTRVTLGEVMRAIGCPNPNEVQVVEYAKSYAAIVQAQAENLQTATGDLENLRTELAVTKADRPATDKTDQDAARRILAMAASFLPDFKFEMKNEAYGWHALFNDPMPRELIIRANVIINILDLLAPDGIK